MLRLASFIRILDFRPRQSKRRACLAFHVADFTRTGPADVPSRIALLSPIYVLTPACTLSIQSHKEWQLQNWSQVFELHVDDATSHQPNNVLDAIIAEVVAGEADAVSNQRQTPTEPPRNWTRHFALEKVGLDVPPLVITVNGLWKNPPKQALRGSVERIVLLQFKRIHRASNRSGDRLAKRHHPVRTGNDSRLHRKHLTIASTQWFFTAVRSESLIIDHLAGQLIDPPSTSSGTS